MKETYIESVPTPKSKLYQKAFLLSWDVPELTQSFCYQKMWESPNDNFYLSIEESITSELSACFPQGCLTMSASFLKKEIDKQINSKRSQKPHAVFVSMDRYYGASADFFIDQTRVIDSIDGTPMAGNRPNTKNLAQQIKSLAPYLANQLVYLVDVGTFEGSSALTLANSLKENLGIKIFGTIFGISTNIAENIIKSNNLDYSTSISLIDPIDWIESRDFIPFTPLSGRVVGNNGLPFQQQELSFSIPYLLPDGNPEKWASIPNEQALSLSKVGWFSSLKLWKEISSLNQINPTLKDIIAVSPRVSFPGWPEEKPNLNTPLLTIIENKLNQLN